MVPHGPLGDAIVESCDEHGVRFVGPRVDGDVGIFHVLPEQKIVHYQRRRGAFAEQVPATLNWESMLDAPRAWLHMTGITPLVSANAQWSWEAALNAAREKGIPISMDLNHRPQLGSLEMLWEIASPYMKTLELMVLSVAQLNGILQMEFKGKSTASLKLQPQTPSQTPSQTATFHTCHAPVLPTHMARVHSPLPCPHRRLL